MFKVLFWFQVNNMTHSLETKIQVVILITKYESSFMVIHELQVRISSVVNKHNCRT